MRVSLPPTQQPNNKARRSSTSSTASRRTSSMALPLPNHHSAFLENFTTDPLALPSTSQQHPVPPCIPLPTSLHPCPMLSSNHQDNDSGRKNTANSLNSMNILVIDNNLVRAEITAHYLRRIGAKPEISFVNGDDLWMCARQETILSSPPPLAQDQLSMGFVEMVSGEGEWRSGSAALSAPVPPPKLRTEVTKWTTAYLKRVYEGARRADSRLLSAKESSSVPLMLLANEHDPKLEAAAISVGFRGVVVKPLRSTSLAACLFDVLGISRSKEGLCRVEEGGSSPSSALDLLKGKNFIVVDDNAVNRKVASKVLEKYGVIVTCFSSGEDALKALTGDHSFDLVFMDIQMPGMSGYETTQAIRTLEVDGKSHGPLSQQNKNHTPIIAMTADVLKGSWEKCKESGMDGFVTKPIEEPRLLQVVIEWLPPVGDEEGDEED